jgi:hypothetical protein
MRQLFIFLMIIAMTTSNSTIAQTQNLDFSIVKAYEHQFDDVMEIIDTTYLKAKLVEVERNFQ